MGGANGKVAFIDTEGTFRYISYKEESVDKRL